MRKLPAAPTCEPTPPKRRNPGRLFALILAIALAPLEVDATRICMGHWREFLWSQSPEVDTPALDWFTDFADTTWNDGRAVVVDAIREPWRPAVIIPFGLIWALIMCMPLKHR